MIIELKSPILIGPFYLCLKHVDNFSRTIISANPNKFLPHHVNGLSIFGASWDKPIPHMLSTGLASTKIRC